mmetsp:Transcript_16544/g.36736  ORF Transcript_16544/g.36736 Transcript_16544/m.36736 type:complete len:126 (+) Transcript_16544:1216-1593(+)
MSAIEAPSGYASSKSLIISVFCFFIVAAWREHIAFVVAPALLPVNRKEHAQCNGKRPHLSARDAASKLALNNSRIHPTLAPCSAARQSGVAPRLSFSRRSVDDEKDDDSMKARTTDGGGSRANAT